MILADISLGDLLWTMLWMFFLFILIMIFFQIITDLFRDHEMSGVGKALWVIALIFFTPITMLIYLIVRGGGMAKRQMAAQQAAQAEFASYVQTVGGGSATPAQQIEQAKALLDSGAISQEEFDRLKAKALS